MQNMTEANQVEVPASRAAQVIGWQMTYEEVYPVQSKDNNWPLKPALSRIWTVIYMVDLTSSM